MDEIAKRIAGLMVWAMVIAIGLTIYCWVVYEQPPEKLDLSPYQIYIEPEENINIYQKCASMFTKAEEGLINKLVSTWRVGSERTVMVSLPKTVNCNGEDMPYAVTIGEDYIQTDINGYYAKIGINEGVISRGVTIPQEKISQGVAVIIHRKSTDNLYYSYELR